MKYICLIKWTEWNWTVDIFTNILSLYLFLFKQLWHYLCCLLLFFLCMLRFVVRYWTYFVLCPRCLCKCPFASTLRTKNLTEFLLFTCDEKIEGSGGSQVWNTRISVKGGRRQNFGMRRRWRAGKGIVGNTQVRAEVEYLGWILCFESSIKTKF